MKDTALVITSIADDSHPILNRYASDAKKHNVPLIVIGDTKSPDTFGIDGCDFYSIRRQLEQEFRLSRNLPVKHYARKNIGYLIAMKQGAKVIIETDDDNIPKEAFWTPRSSQAKAPLITNQSWVNVYKYFTKTHIWPRGFNLEEILTPLPELGRPVEVYAPIQQGLADANPDVDAIYRLTLPLPVTFDDALSIALAARSICPFNSQNTTWFEEAFPLLYLPSFCSFRMTDIWRSFVAQRIAWTCGWSILFHSSTVLQERNEHRLLKDFEDEVSGYINNAELMNVLAKLPLKDGIENIYENLECCYRSIIKLGLIRGEEMTLLRAWIKDIQN